jgi:hypothetical protein
LKTGKDQVPTETNVPGLSRLISGCQRHSFPLKLSPPPSLPFKQGELVLGTPLDPQLAAVYQRLGAAEFGELALYSPTSEEKGLVATNELLRKYDSPEIQSSLIFGWEPGFALYYGTVPQLADSQGVQPVVHINGYEAYAVPVASSVDRFFDAYSRYLELVAVDPEYLHHGVTIVNFPWAMTALIAQDEPLMELVRAGRFDFLTNNFRDAVQWIQELRDAKP